MNVMLVGAGGIGTAILYSLDFKHVRRLAIVDYDSVELTNLNRQFLFAESDIGRPKVSAIASWIGCHYGQDIICEPICSRIQSLPRETVLAYDLFICAVDNLEARLYLNRLLFGLRRQGLIGSFVIVDCGSEKFMGHVQVVGAEGTACIECAASLFAASDSINVNYCAVKRIPQNFDDCIKIALLRAPAELTTSFPGPDDEAQRNDKSSPISAFNDKALMEAHTAAISKAKEYSIEPKQYAYTENFIRNFSLNIASTNSIVASIACHALAAYHSQKNSEKNYITVNCENGFLVDSYKLDRNDSCQVCCDRTNQIELRLAKGALVSDLYDELRKHGAESFCLFTSGGDMVLNTRHLQQGKLAPSLSIAELFEPYFKPQTVMALECFYKGGRGKYLLSVHLSE